MMHTRLYFSCAENSPWCVTKCQDYFIVKVICSLVAVVILIYALLKPASDIFFVMASRMAQYFSVVWKIILSLARVTLDGV
jgi:hypothetical protein